MSPTFQKNDRVMANVAREYPTDYALGAVPAHVVKVPATVWDAGRDAGIGWLIVKLDETSDSHPQLMSEYVHIPADRCALA